MSTILGREIQKFLQREKYKRGKAEENKRKVTEETGDKRENNGLERGEIIN